MDIQYTQSGQMIVICEIGFVLLRLPYCLQWLRSLIVLKHGDPRRRKLPMLITKKIIKESKRDEKDTISEHLFW